MPLKKEQYALVAFLYHDNNVVKMLTEHDLQSNTVKPGTRGRAIVEQRNGARAVVRGVQFERMERRATRQNDGCMYVCVLKATNPFDASVGSEHMLDLKHALRQWKEVYVLWKHVPECSMVCYACNAPLRERCVVLFENSMPVCTAYCSFFSALYSLSDYSI